jgi:hypothetical protein
VSLEGRAVGAVVRIRDVKRGCVDNVGPTTADQDSGPIFIDVLDESGRQHRRRDPQRGVSRDDQVAASRIRTAGFEGSDPAVAALNREPA